MHTVRFVFDITQVNLTSVVEPGSGPQRLDTFVIKIISFVFSCTQFLN
jgi:hypothetical protein